MIKIEIKGKYEINATCWVSSESELPKHCEIVLAALFNVENENYGYYVGLYNEETKEWYLTDYGYAYNVEYWMPIPHPEKGWENYQMKQ